jgi:hypothetical protein
LSPQQVATDLGYIAARDHNITDEDFRKGLESASAVFPGGSDRFVEMMSKNLPGVAPTTVRRWRNGNDRPPAKVRAVIIRVARRLLMRAAGLSQ